MIGGSLYPQDFPWTDQHLFRPPYAAGRTPGVLQFVTSDAERDAQAMAEIGYCPSGRLFEAAACGAAIITDEWEGLSTFLAPG